MGILFDNNFSKVFFMIRLISKEEIDRDKWDYVINNSYNSLVYAYSWYLDFICDKWVAVISNDYEVVMPFFIRKKMLISYIYMPFFTQKIGFFSKTEPNEKIKEQLIKALPSKYRIVNISLIDASLNRMANYEIVKKLNFELNLSSTYQDIYKNYSTNLKRNLKKKDKLKITEHGSLDLFMNLRKKVMQSTNIKDVDFKNFILLTKFAIDNNKAKSYFSYNNGELVAIVIFLFGNKKIVVVPASNQLGRKTNSISKIIDKFILEHSNTNYILDFAGSSIPSIAKFYQKFGTHKTYYYHLKKQTFIQSIYTFIRKKTSKNKWALLKIQNSALYKIIKTLIYRSKLKL